MRGGISGTVSGRGRSGGRQEKLGALGGPVSSAHLGDSLLVKGGADNRLKAISGFRNGG